MRTFLAILMLLVAAAAVFYVGWLHEERARMAKEGTDEQPEARATTTLASYFRDQLIDRGVRDVGRPVEGFDAQLLTMAYPGLTLALFDGIDTFEGRYELSTTTGELEFVPDNPERVSSAAATLDEHGYATLLQRLTSYLAHPAGTERQVDALIDRIDTGERLSAGLVETAAALGVEITPREVLEDSRCPHDVECVQAGTVRILATVALDEESGESEELELGVPLALDGTQVVLTRVLPLPEAEHTIAPEDYELTFRVLKIEEEEG